MGKRINLKPGSHETWNGVTIKNRSNHPVDLELTPSRWLTREHRREPEPPPEIEEED